jgi:hypothetical protein
VLRGQRNGSPPAVNPVFIQVAPQLSSQGWVDPVPDPLLLRKCSSARNRTRDLGICSQELWPLDHRGSQWTKHQKLLHHWLKHIISSHSWQQWWQQQKQQWYCWMLNLTYTVTTPMFTAYWQDTSVKCVFKTRIPFSQDSLITVYCSHDAVLNRLCNLVFFYSFCCGSAIRSRKLRFNGHGDPLRWPHDTLSPQKLALTSPTSGGRLVSIVSMQTKSHRV